MFRSVPTRREIEKSKTTAKKFKKLKDTITDSFEAKIGRKRPRKIENKNYRSVSFLSGTKQKIKKNSKKIQKTKKHRYGFISSQNRLENDEMGIK